MELRRYFYPLMRWWWLLLTATLVAGVFSFVATLQQPPAYQAATTLMIGRAIEDPNPSSNEFWLSQQLAETYADIAKRERVREATMKALGLNFLPQYEARAQPNSQLIDIIVVDTIPERAQAVANELANQLIQASPTGAEQTQNQQQFINLQLDSIKAQIEETTKEITQKQGELGGMDSARQITDTQNQIAALQAKLTSLQGNYANLFSLTSQGAVNSLSVIEPAGLPTRPVGPGRMVSVLLAAMIGLILAAAAAYLIEYLDDTLRRPEDIKRVFQAPILGSIADIGAHTGAGDGVFVAKNPRHPVVEAFRSLRTNLEFASVDQPLKTLLITSSDTQVGKTSLACNLAVVIAQAEKSVILLDADLRRPRVHEYFAVSNSTGLSDVFVNRATVEEVLIHAKDKGIRLITSGPTPPNPSELLGSRRMDQILDYLKGMADVVIIDGPPFIVADAAVLSSKADGILLVVRPSFTHEGAARAMMDQIKRAGGRVVGVAMNRVPAGQAAYFGGGYYGSPYYAGSSYYGDEEIEKKPGRLARLLKFSKTPPTKTREDRTQLPKFRPDLTSVDPHKKTSE